MNKIIALLLDEKEKNEKELKAQQYVIKTLENTLSDEIHKETGLLNKVLQNNLIPIIDMIHKQGLKCTSVKNTETIWGHTVYTVSDDFYFRNIEVENGNITTNTHGIDNDGGGKELHEKVKILIGCCLIPFCNKEKIKYEDEK